MFAVAKEYDTRVVDVVLLETELRTGLSREEILTGIMNEYAHNLKAVEIGVKDGESILLGTVASQLAAQPGPKCFEDPFLDDALLYTLGAQVGNHCIGLRPCAGTGDSCPYSGFIKAMMVHGYDEKTIAETAALILKIGSLFRVGKVTTGCNMEGYGAGSACIAAATVSLGGGTPEQMEKAMVLALSPTIAVPCTPRVLVPALCTTHVGGAILMGMYAGKLCMKVDMTVNVPFDVMLAMAAEVHVESGHHIVPTVVEYMEPFFKRKPAVEALVRQEVKDAEAKKMAETMDKAAKKAKQLATVLLRRHPPHPGRRRGRRQQPGRGQPHQRRPHLPRAGQGQDQEGPGGALSRAVRPPLHQHPRAVPDGRCARRLHRRLPDVQQVRPDDPGRRRGGGDRGGHRGCHPAHHHHAPTR